MNLLGLCMKIYESLSDCVTLRNKYFFFSLPSLELLLCITRIDWSRWLFQFGFSSITFYITHLCDNQRNAFAFEWLRISWEGKKIFETELTPTACCSSHELTGFAIPKKYFKTFPTAQLRRRCIILFHYFFIGHSMLDNDDFRARFDIRDVSDDCCSRKREKRTEIN